MTLLQRYQLRKEIAKYEARLAHPQIIKGAKKYDSCREVFDRMTRELAEMKAELNSLNA